MSRHEKEQVTLANMCMLRDGMGRVLVLDRKDKHWSGLAFPGGHVEKGESLTDAIIREMREETGLTIRHPRLVGIKDWPDSAGRYIVLLYVAQEYEGKLTSSAEGEVFWCPLEELKAREMASDMQETLRVMLEEQLSEQWYDQPEPDGPWQMMLK